MCTTQQWLTEVWTRPFMTVSSLHIIHVRFSFLFLSPFPFPPKRLETVHSLCPCLQSLPTPDPTLITALTLPSPRTTSPFTASVYSEGQEASALHRLVAKLNQLIQHAAVQGADAYPLSRALPLPPTNPHSTTLTAVVKSGQEASTA